MLAWLTCKAKPSSPSGDLLASLPSEAWPQDNEAEEAELRQALHALVALPVAKARAQILELEQKHGMRRRWVWAKLGRTPLAQAIHHLSRTAEDPADWGVGGRPHPCVYHPGLAG